METEGEIDMGEINNREIVLDMLLSVERQETYSHLLIKDVLTKYDYLAMQEKAFIKRLFEGTIERKIELDYIIDNISSVPVHKMKPLIRCLLRMSSYQILYMDSVPDSAAVNEAVKLAGKRKFQNLKGFINGVLRKLTSTKENLAKPDEKKEPTLYLSVNYSMPEWIIEHFLSLYSYEDVKKLLQGMLEIKPVCIRFQRKLNHDEIESLLQSFTEKGVEVSKNSMAENAYFLKHCDNIAMLPGFSEGYFTVQDVSSMMAVEAAGIKPGDFVLDVCAAPGGKTMLAAEYTGKEGRVVARDVSEAKTDLIHENIERMKLQNVFVEVWDGRTPDQNMKEKADVVLADVPCSGLGVMGKKRDIKYRQKPEALTEIVTLQREILEQAVTYVKPEGCLLFSTCTINPKENMENTSWICKEHGFTLIEDRQFLPGKDETDGFYYAKLIKK